MFKQVRPWAENLNSVVPESLETAQLEAASGASENKWKKYYRGRVPRPSGLGYAAPPLRRWWAAVGNSGDCRALEKHLKNKCGGQLTARLAFLIVKRKKKSGHGGNGGIYCWAA
jgi:hypothetical protein